MDVLHILSVTSFGYRLDSIRMVKFNLKERHGFHLTTDKKLEEDSEEYLVRLER